MIRVFTPKNGTKWNYEVWVGPAGTRAEDNVTTWTNGGIRLRIEVQIWLEQNAKHNWMDVGPSPESASHARRRVLFEDQTDAAKFVFFWL